MTDLTTVVARLREKVSAARRNPTVLRDGRPVVTIDCDEATALLAVAEAAAEFQAVIPDAAADALSDDPYALGVWRRIGDALAALNDPTREDT